MAERRMFNKQIIDSDKFLDMPLSAQALYFHLSMRADDEGFINNPKKIQRSIGATNDDLKLLIAKDYLIPFESGVIVIKHWKIHNYIRNDRFKPTLNQEEKRKLILNDTNEYLVGIPNDNQMTTNGIPNDNQMDTQVSIGKSKDSIELDKSKYRDSIELEKELEIDKARLVKCSGSLDECDKDAPPPPLSNTSYLSPSLIEVQNYCYERNSNVDPNRFYNYYQSRNWCIGKNRITDWKAKVREWETNKYSDKKDDGLPNWWNDTDQNDISEEQQEKNREEIEALIKQMGNEMII